MKLKEAIDQLANTSGASFDNLTNSQWEALEQYCSLTKEFSNVTHSLEGDEYTTISLVIPSVKNLLVILQDFVENDDSRAVRMASRQLKDAVNKRFSYILDPNDSKFEPFYSLATALHPPFHRLLDAQLRRKALLEATRLHKKLMASESTDLAALTETQPAEAVAPLEKKGRFSALSSLLGSKGKVPKNASVEKFQSSVELRFEKYLEVDYDFGDSEDPVEFWTRKLKEYPILALFALLILSCPATSAPCERVFSHCSYAHQDRRSNLNYESLECEVMFQCNQEFC